MALPPKVSSLIDALPAVSLEQLDRRAAMLRRVDSKYVFDSDTFVELVRRLSGDHQVLEIDGRRTFSYQSVYFDTPELRCFHDHVGDRAPRFKVRTRLYRDTGKCVFEIKLKPATGETDKRHIPYRPEAAKAIDADARKCIAEALADAQLQPPPELGATLRTQFDRITLSPAAGGERTTCDVGIDLEQFGGGAARLKPGLVVVETKSEDGNSPTDRILSELRIEPISLSKYRTGIALLSAGEDPGSAAGAERFFERTR